LVFIFSLFFVALGLQGSHKSALLRLTGLGEGSLLWPAASPAFNRVSGRRQKTSKRPGRNLKFLFFLLYQSSSKFGRELGDRGGPG